MKKEPFDEIEHELRSLRPLPVKPKVMTGWLDFDSGVDIELQRDLKRSLSPFRRSMWLLAALVCLTGFLGALVVRQGWNEIKSNPTQIETLVEDSTDTPLLTDLAFSPSSLKNRFVGASDDGIIGAVGDVSFRRVRYQLMDTYHWANLEDGSSLEMIIPREEILFLPVVTY
ncbi:hypothetical protein N9B57_04265 [Verrucomicrobia bacterium]|jgi:hypothetical protein|nr:hypothetical protein [Verrucomicrobiota bacterium]